MKKLVSFVLTLSILALMVPSAITRFANVVSINEQFLGYIVKAVFLVLMFLFLMFSLSNNYDEFGNAKIHFNWQGAVYFILFVIIFAVTSKINSQPIMWRLSGYFLLLMAVLFMTLENNDVSFSKTGMYWGIVVYTIPNAVLGMIQYITTKPIVPIVNQSGTQIGATTRLNDVSSLGFLASNGGYRAFGMFDSGMALGLFLLLSLSVLFYGNLKVNALLKLVLEVFFTITLVMTLTRNIYFLYIILVGLRFVKKVRVKRLLFLIGIFIQAFTIGMAGVMNSFSFFQGSFFDTLRARYRGLIYFQNYYHQNVLSVFFGRGYQYDTFVKTVTQNMVDNQMMATFLDIGLLGIMTIYMLFWKTMKLKNNQTSPVLQNMMIIFSFFGIANNHIVFFSGILLLTLLCINSNQKIGDNGRMRNGISAES